MSISEKKSFNVYFCCRLVVGSKYKRRNSENSNLTAGNYNECVSHKKTTAAELICTTDYLKLGAFENFWERFY